MSIKPERQFRHSVTKHLVGRGLLVWAIHDSYSSGVPDHYYSGNKADLWIEYKHFPWDRVSFDLTIPEKRPKLTRLQQEWLNDQYDRGRNVWVVVGMPAGGVILRDKEWMKPVTVDKLLSRKELAAEILKLCE